MKLVRLTLKLCKVAPPHGERGLKFIINVIVKHPMRRSPSWGAWIEIDIEEDAYSELSVAPPHGERGLKFFNL